MGKNNIDKEHNIFTYMCDRILFVENIENIIYFESDNRKIMMHTFDENVEFYGRLKDLYGIFSEYGFDYINQSVIANLNYIKKINKEKVVLKNNEVLYLSRTRKKMVRAKIVNMNKK